MTITEYRAEDGSGGELRLYAEEGQSAGQGEKSHGYAYVLLRCARDFLELVGIGAGGDPIMLGAIIYQGYNGKKLNDFKERLDIDPERFRDSIVRLLIARSFSDGGRGESSVIGDDLAGCLGLQ
jgi:hypothetical protein